MTPESRYEKSAAIYDLLYVGTGIKDYAAESAELHRIIDESSPGAKTLLDVACGTGAHLAELRRWYAVEGADLSPPCSRSRARAFPTSPCTRPTCARSSSAGRSTR